jgi:hypothetical protein
MNWSKTEEAELKRLVRQGLPWKQIAAAMPGRTASACQRKAHSLRERGKGARHPGRAKPGGAGAGAGRPPNARASVKLSFRLGADVRAAWLELCEAVERGPGSVLSYALQAGPRLEREPEAVVAELGSRPLRPRRVEPRSRVAVCWCVPRRHLRAATRRLGTSNPRAAELTVLAMLRAFGYTIEEPS